MGTAAPRALPPLIAALLDARCYPHAVAPVNLIETHISWVLLAGEYAYKIKKPVALGFLDFSTLDARRHFCNEELRLNRAFAPDLYLEVLTVTGSPQAPQFGGSGRVLEYALKMRRFAQDQLLDAMADKGLLDATVIDRLAVRMAAAHADAAVADAQSGHGTPAQIVLPALDNFTQITALGAPPEAATALADLRAWTAAASTGLAPAFAARKAAGRVRECHGDLHLGNIVLIDGEPTPFDCIEFNAKFRWIDVMSEIAFLVMDLLDRNLPALAWRSLNAYLESSGDHAGLTVLRYYLVYRAMVRAKVALIHARQNIASDVRRGDEQTFVHHVRLAQVLTAPPPPALILMHGFSGSGKTRVAGVLAENLAAVRIRSDVERKRLFGLAADATSESPPGAGIYTAAAAGRTYDRLAELAALAVGAGWRVVVDAASLKRAERARFCEIARVAGARFVLVACGAPDDVLRQRIARRRAVGVDASEATAAVLAYQHQHEEPLDDGERALAVTVAPDGNMGVLVERLRALLGVPPARR